MPEATKRLISGALVRPGHDDDLPELFDSARSAHRAPRARPHSSRRRKPAHAVSNNLRCVTGASDIDIDDGTTLRLSASIGVAAGAPDGLP